METSAVIGICLGILLYIVFLMLWDRLISVFEFKEPRAKRVGKILNRTEFYISPEDKGVIIEVSGEMTNEEMKKVMTKLKELPHKKFSQIVRHELGKPIKVEPTRSQLLSDINEGCM